MNKTKMKKARSISAKFIIREDSHNAGVTFYTGNNKVDWKDLTAKEQVKMLNAWGLMYRLFYEFLKDDQD